MEYQTLRRRRIGTVFEATPDHVERAIASAGKSMHAWDRRGGPARAALLEKAADLMERDRARLMGVVVREAGKTLDAALSEVREAVDFLRYYAGEARRQCAGPTVLPGPTGERNTIELCGRGVFACISPWNFPLAIFTGQVAAALAAGNAVIAKPAEQTPVTAFLAVELMHAAGIPGNVLHLLPGDGSVGAALSKDARIAGLAFTGSNAVGMSIMRVAASSQAMRPVLAEMGGKNPAFVTPSADLAVAASGVARSAFGLSGQKCSALAKVYVARGTTDAFLDDLVDATRKLVIGDPRQSNVFTGPVINGNSLDRFNAACSDAASAGSILIGGRNLEGVPAGIILVIRDQQFLARLELQGTQHRVHARRRVGNEHQVVGHRPHETRQRATRPIELRFEFPDEEPNRFPFHSRPNL